MNFFYWIAVVAFIVSIATVLWDAVRERAELRKSDPTARLPWNVRRIIIAISSVLGLVSLIATLVTLDY